MSPPIPILGAGLAGLTLSRALLHHGIPSILYDAASAQPRHNYAITLHRTAYERLLPLLGLDELAFKKAVAVDAGDETAGLGNIHGTHMTLASHGDLYSTSRSFRANRARLEGLLGRGLDVRWGWKVRAVTGVGSVGFENGEERCGEEGGVIVAADGVHSTVRNTLMPQTEVGVLPFVVFNGKRRVEHLMFKEVYAPIMAARGTTIEYKCGDTLLTISLYDTHEEKNYTGISWTYSRPARPTNDPLHAPSRTPAQANSILPEAFFSEISSLQHLPTPFSHIFATEDIRKDRILHWLMRTCLPPLADLQAVLEQNRIAFIGDAVHAQPILGGNGANAAILDGVGLAERISDMGSSGDGVGCIADWYRGQYSVWRGGVEGGEREIAKMHGV